MRDAFGGSVNIFLIMVFIAIALGYVAFNVNYTKAFRMKDKVISVYEKYKGNCSAECQKEIDDYSKKIIYDAEGMSCSNGYEMGKPEVYCIQVVDATYSDGKGNTETKTKADEEDAPIIRDRNTKCYYKIKTRVKVSLPIIGNLKIDPSWDVFTVKGDTKAIEIDGKVCKKG